MILLGTDIKNKKTFIRGGIIPYSIWNNKYYFLLAEDRKTKELSDFGGGIKQPETCFEGTIREFNEETCDIFRKLNLRGLLEHSRCIVNPKFTHAIFFMHIPNKWLKISNTLFHNSLSKEFREDYLENSNIHWINLEDFISILDIPILSVQSDGYCDIALTHKTNTCDKYKVWVNLKLFIKLFGPSIFSFLNDTQSIKSSR